jgi:hypothetical protein
MVVVSGSVVKFIRGLCLFRTAVSNFQRDQISWYRSFFTYILLSHPVEFRCEIYQIEEDQLVGYCATGMPEKTLNEELYGRKERGRQGKRWIRDVDDVSMIIAKGWRVRTQDRQD